MSISKQAISKHTARRRAQAGYSLLMVVFMVATILVLMAATTPNILTQGRRERETEMVWRGQQYERAIGMYYKKFGRYPTKIDDLTKQTNGLRFLRQAYTDPMNKEDGTWRFIYVGPNGQLIGSLKTTSLLQSVMSTPAAPGSSGLGSGLASAIGSVLGGGGSGGTSGAGSTSGVGAIGGPSGPGGSGGIGAVGGPNGGGSGMPGAPGTTGGASGVGQFGQQTSGATTATSDSSDSQPQPLGGTVIGGNIIGVGSKIKQSSFLVYNGEDTYQKWEFIWNPMQQVAIPGQQSGNPNVPAPPQSQAGTNPGTPGAAQPPNSGTGTPGTPSAPLPGQQDNTTPQQVF